MFYVTLFKIIIEVKTRNIQQQYSNCQEHAINRTHIYTLVLSKAFKFTFD